MNRLQFIEVQLTSHFPKWPLEKLSQGFGYVLVATTLPSQYKASEGTELLQFVNPVEHKCVVFSNPTK